MAYLILIALTFAAAGIGGAASIRAGDFYGALARPDWAPPASLFGPVWTVLYGMMAIAACLVWHKARVRAKVPLSLYLAQIVLNALWTWLFFHWRSGGWAFAEILALWLAIAATLVVFYQVRPLAGWLMIPYLLWVTYASALTYSLWRMNPGVL